MPDYNNGKIYKLIDYTNNSIYYGSTSVRLLSARKSGHQTSYNAYLKDKMHYLSSFEIVKNNNWDCILVENYPCNNNKELTKRESYYIENFECINVRTSGGRHKDNNKKWRKENNKLPHRIAYQKDYHANYRFWRMSWGQDQGGHNLLNIDVNLFAY